MMMTPELIAKTLKELDLKVTPQRVVVLKTIADNKSHPTAEEIHKAVIKNQPNVAVGTVYNILETFVNNGIVEKISSKGDKMRYDLVSETHHHLVSKNSDLIQDYYDDELTGIIGRYLDKNTIPGFKVSGFKLNISGKFNKSGKN